MSNNPFSLTFGIEPSQYISRYSQRNEIVDTFTSEKPSNYVYMISGVRGAGKTVMLADITNDLASREDWVVINVTPDVDILNSIAAKLYSNAEMKKLFMQAKLDFSAFGLGVSIAEGIQIFDIETAVERMLTEIKKEEKRVLIAVDEVVNNNYVKIFAGVFQVMLREKLPIFLIMTGLYGNIYDLQNEKTLTFLYRAPKIMLTSLSVGAIARSYQKVLDVEEEVAERMAKLTKGYPFAYQALGYLYWKNNNEKGRREAPEELLGEFDEILETYVYEKIWTELSEKEKMIAAAIPPSDEIKVADIRKKMDLAANEMSVYRERLKRKGVINASKHGYLSFSLPRFGEVIRYWVE